MGLDKKTRNCQKFETYNECVTNHYINKVLNQCGCSPSLLSLTKKVKKIMLEEIDNVWLGVNWVKPRVWYCTYFLVELNQPTPNSFDLLCFEYGFSWTLPIKPYGQSSVTLIFGLRDWYWDLTITFLIIQKHAFCLTNEEKNCSREIKPMNATECMRWF